MTDRKLSKRYQMTVIQGNKVPPARSYFGNDPICTMHQHFQLRRKHLKGSNRPAGWLHGSIHDGTVDVRWLWTEDLGFFAPEITFKPRAFKTVTKVAKAFDSLGYRDGTPDNLCIALKALAVEFIDDNKDGCWDDYRLIRDYTENAMLTLARAAQ